MFNNPGKVTRQIFLPTVELIASLCETYVFILLGLGVFLMKRAFNWPLIGWSLLACLLGRALNVYPLAFLTNKVSSGPIMSIKEMHMVWMAGLRGVIAFICALGFPRQEDHQDYLLCTTVILVGLSLLLLGWPTAAVLRCLKLDSSVALQEPRIPRVSWSTMPGSASVRGASQRLKKLLMTNDAVAEEEIHLFEETNGGTGAAPSAPVAPAAAGTAMGCMGSFDAGRIARWSAPGVLGTAPAERLSRLSARRMSMPSRSSRMLCDM